MTLVQRYRTARRDPTLAVLEGFHALKHALRFGADLVHAATSDRERALALADSLAPDVHSRLDDVLEDVAPEVLAELSPARLGEPIIALARRPRRSLRTLLDDAAPAPLVLLDHPRHLGNIGACVRVGAAAGAAGLVAIGEHDPWHPHAIRGGAGLQLRLPTFRADALPETDRPIVAIAPGGATLRPGIIPPRAVLAFGSERRGLGEAVLDRADLRLGIPMEPGVSSLSLATAVAVALYAWRGVVG